MNKILRLTMILLLVAPVVSLYAKPVDRPNQVDCSKTTLQSEIDKLDKSATHSLNISGDCTEDVVVAGFADLTLIGAEGASLTATSFVPGDTVNSTNALLIEHSKVTVQTLTINSGNWGVSCLRSTCDILDATIQGGNNGLHYQDHSKGAVLGSTVIKNSLTTGLGVYGASSVNIRLEDTFNAGPGGPGPVISGHGFVGAAVLDGSFLRADDATFSGNEWGVWAHRNAAIKIYGNDGGVINNVRDGIYVDHSSTAAVALPINDNGGAGIWVGPLSSFHDQGVTFSGNETEIRCAHSTSISEPPSWCGN